MGDRKPNLRSSIYCEPDGSWHGWVTMGTKDDGSPDRRHRRGRTESEVASKVRELQHGHRADCPEGWRKRGHRCPEVKRPCRPGCTGHPCGE